jgi:hypothetical protein
MTSQSNSIAIAPEAGLPCWQCQHPRAREVRHLLGQAGLLDDTQRSPAGLPLNCCRIRLVGMVPQTE